MFVPQLMSTLSLIVRAHVVSMEMCDEYLGEPARFEGAPHQLDLRALATVEHPAAQLWGVGSANYSD